MSEDNPWTEHVQSTDDSPDSDNSEENAGEEVSFTQEFAKAVNSASVAEFDPVELAGNIDEIEDSGLLRKSLDIIDSEENAESYTVIKNRIESLEPANNDREDTKDSDKGVEGSDRPVSKLEQSNDESPMEEKETPSRASQGPSRPSEQAPTPANAISIKEVIKNDRRWMFLVWGPPKTFKTFLSMSLIEPIAFIDLEGKADDIAGKFSDKDIQIWQPKEMEAEPDTDFRKAKKAVQEAIEWLDWYRVNENRVGTIVIDSMSQMWEHAQMHHKIVDHPLSDPSEIELSANIGSKKESNWAVIKEYHNPEFRDIITESPYHFCWTAMERLSFEESLQDEDNRRFYEPIGEPRNDYKCNVEIRARKDKDRGKVGDLIGSNFIDNSFVGMKKPTFEKIKKAIEIIQDAEISGDITRKELLEELENADIDVEAVIDYDPQVYVQMQGKD